MADIWSLGCILYILIENKLPFGKQNILDKIKALDATFFGKFEPVLQDLLIKMLCKSPPGRSTIKQIKSHHWFCV